MGVPNKQNVFHFNKPLYSLGTWAGDMNDKGITGISRQGFLRRKKKTKIRIHLVLSVFMVHVFFFYQEKYPVYRATCILPLDHPELFFSG